MGQKVLITDLKERKKLIYLSSNYNSMKWYHYIAAFFAGAFIANTVPHFIHGVSGDKFPTPFANPPGKGLSSPMVNVAWSLLNLVVGVLLYRVSKISRTNIAAIIIFFIGVAVMSFMLAMSFADKMAQ